MRVCLITAVLAGTAAAAPAQTATFRVLLSPAGPVGQGDRVDGVVRVEWSYPGAVGYLDGAFRLRMDGLSVGDVDVPNEIATERVGINGAATVWSSGRRPRTFDGASGESGGGFRFLIPQGTGPTQLSYRVENQAGATYLTGRNGSNIENRIEHVQDAAFNNPFFITDTAFDLFRFSVRAPTHGVGTVTITPEISIAAILLTPNGANTNVPATGIGASFTYLPGPGAVGLLCWAGASTLPRRRR
jgi:hypothetical protein